jgi:Dolichyl-phosphate-mannose-protein mannosyltransferase
MSEKLNRWIILVLAAGIPRILAALFLPNSFGDAYVYIRDIGSMSTKLKAGTFALTDFYGFWLPLYQFLSALLNVFVGNGFYSGKIISAIFGVGTCLFVYAIAEQLTQHRAASLLAFFLIALNPLHILTSSSALTDVPHAFFVLASLYFVLKRRWLVAAIFAALAGLTRVESWMFIVLIPLIQFLWERRVSIPAVLIMLIPPLLWFYVSWKAAGDWLACFKVRQQYHDWLLQQNPALAHFSVFGVLKDGAIFINSIDIAVLVAALVAGWIVLRRQLTDSKFALNPLSARGEGAGGEVTPRVTPTQPQKVLPPVVFFFAFFALLSGAYLTHQQPIIFPRYGLILFSIGIPILAWTYVRLAQRETQKRRKLLVAIIVVCVLGASVQLAGAAGWHNQYKAQRAVAEYLRERFKPETNQSIFCDEGTVRTLSGIPESSFVISSDAPRDREGFVALLKDRKVEYVVIAKEPESTPRKLFPELDSGGSNEFFYREFQVSTRFLPTEIWIYRFTSPP